MKKVFSYLRKQNIYFKKHYIRAPGCPDIAIPPKKIAFFIDGDFWHGWKFSQIKNNLPEFWHNKIKKNIERDKKNRRKLRVSGWKVIRIWGHSLKNKEKFTLEKIKNFLITN